MFRVASYQVILRALLVSTVCVALNTFAQDSQNQATQNPATPATATQATPDQKAADQASTPPATPPAEAAQSQPKDVAPDPLHRSIDPKKKKQQMKDYSKEIKGPYKQWLSEA